MSTKAKVITIISITLVLALTLFIYFRFFFVYSSGVNAGDINYFQRQGIVFKTYEGKMIQSGLEQRVQVLGDRQSGGRHVDALLGQARRAALETLHEHPPLARQQPVHRHRSALGGVRRAPFSGTAAGRVDNFSALIYSAL